MSQRAGPGFATGQTTSAWSLAQRKKDAGIESSTRGASSDRAARGFGADSPGMGPQGRISVPAESAGDLGGPTSRSDIFLDDVSVSRRHVELRWEKDDFHDTPPRSQASGITPKAPSTSPATATTFRSCSAAATREEDLPAGRAQRRVGLQSCLYTLHPVMRRKAHVGQRRRDLCGAAIELTDRLATELRSFNAVRSTRLCTVR